MCVPFGWILKQEDFEKGLNVLLTDIKRIPPSSVDPTIKNYHWMDFCSSCVFNKSFTRSRLVSVAFNRNSASCLLECNPVIPAASSNKLLLCSGVLVEFQLYLEFFQLRFEVLWP